MKKINISNEDMKRILTHGYTMGYTAGTGRCWPEHIAEIRASSIEMINCQAMIDMPDEIEWIKNDLLLRKRVGKLLNPVALLKRSQFARKASQ